MEIAAEKAGIIKAGVPVVSAPQRAEAEAVIRAKANECTAPLQFVSESMRGDADRAGGAHQKQNAAVALAAMRPAAIEWWGVTPIGPAVLAEKRKEKRKKGEESGERKDE
jgi:folylpolyglutamate synthase/dihydropteroate synthase